MTRRVRSTSHKRRGHFSEDEQVHKVLSSEAIGQGLWRLRLGRRVVKRRPGLRPSPGRIHYLDFRRRKEKVFCLQGLLRTSSTLLLYFPTLDLTTFRRATSGGFQLIVRIRRSLELTKGRRPCAVLVSIAGL